MARKLASQARKVVKQPPSSKEVPRDSNQSSSSDSSDGSDDSGSDTSSSDDNNTNDGNAEFTAIPRFGGKQIRLPPAPSPNDSDSESYASIESGDDDEGTTTTGQIANILVPRKYQPPGDGYRMSIFLRDHLLDIFLSKKESSKEKFYNEKSFREYLATLKNGTVRRSGDIHDSGWKNPSAKVEERQPKGADFATSLTSSQSEVNRDMNKSEDKTKSKKKPKKKSHSDEDSSNSKERSRKSKKKKKKKSSSDSERKEKKKSKADSPPVASPKQTVQAPNPVVVSVATTPASVSNALNEVSSNGRAADNDEKSSRRKRSLDQDANAAPETSKKPCVGTVDSKPTYVPVRKNYAEMDPAALVTKSKWLYEEARKMKHIGDKAPTDAMKRGEYYLRSSLRFLEYSIVYEDLRHIFKRKGDLAKAKHYAESAVRILPQTGGLIEVAGKTYEKCGRKDRAAMCFKFAAIVYMYIFRGVRLKLEAIYKELNQVFKSTMVLGSFAGVSKVPSTTVSPSADSSATVSYPTSSSPIPFTSSPPPSGKVSGPPGTSNNSANGSSVSVSKESYSYFLKDIGHLFRGHELWSRSQRLDSTVLPSLTDFATVDLEYALQQVANELKNID